MITRLPPPGEAPPQQQVPPGDPVAERWLPSLAALGRAPYRPGAYASQVSVQHNIWILSAI